MLIYNHAVDRYIERVLGLDDRQTGSTLRTFARSQIILAVRHPNQVYQKDTPIHIRNGCAVPVKRDVGGDQYVPTSYNAGTFLSKMNTNEPARLTS